MKILKITGIVVGVIAVLLIVLYLAAPEQAFMERSAFVKAPPEMVYAVVNNNHNFSEWNPWYEIDPDSEITYDGPEAGIGSKYTWKSDTLGTGSIWIVESIPSKFVSSRMQFEGYDGEPYAKVRLQPEGDGTQVTWSYEEQSKGLYRLGNLINMSDKMLGGNFERGLEKLKTYVENKYSGSTAKISEVETSLINYLGIKSALEESNDTLVSQTIGQSFEKIMTYLNVKDIVPSGMPMSIYTDFEGPEIEMINAVPVEDEIESSDTDIKPGTIKEGTAIKAMHYGDYSKLPETYDQINKYISEKGYKINGDPFEIYVTDPDEVTDTTAWITEVYFPVSK